MRQIPVPRAESIADKCMRNSIEALRRHDSGELRLPYWVVEHHRIRVPGAIPMREPGDDEEEAA